MAGQTTKVTSAKEFGKVAVLMGGTAAEREVSLRSGAAVLAALQSQGVDAHGIDFVGGESLHQLQQGGFDRVFIALHGRGGEDGQLQGALQTIGMPYTGSGVLGSALGMDKLRCKQLWHGAGLPTPKFLHVSESSDFNAVVQALGLPLMVKPAHEGSSIGMSKVIDAAQLAYAVEQAASCDDVVLVERWVTGREYTVAILNGAALPAIRLETPHDFYDFEAKYKSTDTHYHCPCGLNSIDEARLQKLALDAFTLAGTSGWGRIDMMEDQAGNFWLLEVNTVPGMTDHSLVPMAARAAGVSFESLVWQILETSFEERH